MKFMFFFYPALSATLAERKRMRPIARHTEPWQQMFAEVAELSRTAEDLGFDGVETTMPYETLLIERSGSIATVKQGRNEV
jgi:hypothetical protein